MATHHRIVVSERGGPEVLVAVEEALPEPGPGAIRIRTLAAGVSAFDLMLRSKRFPGFPRPPYTPGVDVVGVVDRLGDGVSSVHEGETVAALLSSGNGGYAEFVVAPATDAVPVPGGVDPVEAVCVVANYLTAHLALHATAAVKEGETVLIHGAAGGVGTALVQLGALAGLEMYGTASAHNHGLVTAQGATPIDYRTEDFVKRVRALTGGVDAVFDTIGGGRQLWRSHRALGSRGRLVWFGVAASKDRGARVIPASLLMRALLPLIPDRKRVLTTPDLKKDVIRYRETLGELLGSLAAGRIAPVVAARMPLLDAASAHEMLERGGYAGKVVLIA